MPGDHGAFDSRSSARSTELWAATHRAALLLASVAIAAAASLITRRKPDASSTR